MLPDRLETHTIRPMLPNLKPTTARLATGLLLLLALVSGATAASLARQHAFLLRGMEPLAAPPVPLGGATLGVNVALEQYDGAMLDEQLDQIEGLGITHLKQSFYYSPAYDWATSDRILAALADRPLSLTVLLDGDPATGFAPPENPADFAAWAGAFAARYGDQVDSYMIWDEPNIATHWGGEPINPDLYGALLSGAAAAIRAADSSAMIGAAPLAPTVEQSTANLADPLFLQALYANGSAAAFDFAAAKPYGFDADPLDRTVDIDRLNFSRIVLLREVMVAQGDSEKGLWVGNWGWNALPADWSGSPSIWGEVTPAEQITYLQNGFTRARQEWPWVGVMFWHHWDPPAPATDPIQGFSLQRPALQDAVAELTSRPTAAPPGFHAAAEENPFFTWQGDWRFSPEFGADMSQKADGEPPDTFTFTFEGNEVGLRVRRANYRARLYVLIDGEPANALPHDENTALGWGSALVLNTNDPDSDYIAIEPVATGLADGQHTMTVTAYRGWDQFAVNGVSTRWRPETPFDRWGMVALIVALGSLLGLGWTVPHGRWSELTIWRRWEIVSRPVQGVWTAVVATLVVVAGWLTWNTAWAGAFRRLDEWPQLALVLGSAAIFYITPWLVVYGVALVVLFVLVKLRPAWGIALVALVIPFYVQDLLKPIYIYRFSPVEIFTVVVFGAALAARLGEWGATRQGTMAQPARYRWLQADTAVLIFAAVATASLWFTARLDVATNEWRTVIIGPLLFYATWRLVHPSRREMGVILAAFLTGGTAVALIGLAQYAAGINLITAEAGVTRLRSIYGSPNNVALFLGRQLTLLLALLLFWPSHRRGWLPLFWRTTAGRWAAAAFGIQAAAFLLTLSKGGLLLGLPAGLLTVFVLWQRREGRPVWPWLTAAAVLGVGGYLILLQIPALGERLDIRSATGVLRLNLWRSSLAMWADHPWFGVGLDNFLYEYRGRYILAAAWQEPNLNHPHNFLLDLATRLGVWGVLSGLWLYAQPFWLLRQRLQQTPLQSMDQALTDGIVGALVAMFAHGLVDHSFFLIDLAYTFMFLLGSAVWLYSESVLSQSQFKV